MNLDVKTVAAIVGSVGVVAGVIASLIVSLAPSHISLFGTPYESCLKWEKELLKMMNLSGDITMTNLLKIPQAERDSYHEICRDHTGLLYEHFEGK